MKVICIYNTGDAYKNSVMPDGFFKTSQYGLELGKEFFVMGIVLFENLIMYLVDDNGKPGWYPFQLFKISDNAIASKWHFKIVSPNESSTIQAIWGYFELCFQEGHYDQLLDLEEDSMRIYFERKAEFF